MYTDEQIIEEDRQHQEEYRQARAERMAEHPPLQRLAGLAARDGVSPDVWLHEALDFIRNEAGDGPFTD